MLRGCNGKPERGSGVLIRARARMIHALRVLSGGGGIFWNMPDSYSETPATGPAGPHGRGRALGCGFVVAIAMTLLALIASGPPDTPLGPGVAEARCGERLAADYNIVSRYPKLYASQYKKNMKVSVTTHHGPLVEVQAQLYTFQGKLLGQSKRIDSLNSSKTIEMDLKYGMQEGKFTLVVKGFPRGCHSESQSADVVRFVGCTNSLPLKFPDTPGGTAGDYGGFLSVPIESRRGAVIKDPRSEVYSFGGEFFGSSIDDYKIVFGRVTMNNKLVKPLRPGSYSMEVTGRIDQPRECGPKTAVVTMEFS